MAADLYLAWNLIVKKYKSQALLVLQTVLALLLLMFLLGRIEFLRWNFESANAFTTQDSYFFMPYHFKPASFDIMDTLAKEYPSLSVENGDIRSLTLWEDGQTPLSVLGYNDVILQHCRLPLQEGSWFEDAPQNGEVPAIEIMRYLDSIKYDGDLTVTYSFKAKDFDSSRKLHLVVEYPERAIIKVNGKEVKYAGLPAWRDFRWMPIDITGLVKNGENKIEMHYKDFKHGDLAVYKPQWRRYGTEIEAVYLVGDFSVTSVDTGLKIKNTMAERFKAKETQTVVISKKDLAITNPQPVPYGNVTKSGLPFYSGKLAYTKNVKFPEIKDGERLFLKLQQLDCPVAEVLINGNSVGVIKNAPYEIDVTDYVRGNECEVEIVLYASLRNIMDVMDLPSRKCDYQNGKNKDAVKASLEPLQKFADGSWKSKKWLMDYCQVSFGDIGKVSLITKKFSK